MGDEILKKYTIIFIWILSLYGSPQVDPKLQQELSKFDDIFIQIGKKREGISPVAINKIKDPFIYKREIKNIVKTKNGKKVIPPKKILLKLSAIINNKVKINDKWYRLRQKVGNYRLVRIKKGSVLLRQGREKLKLFLRKRDAKIKFTIR
jgi:hypothetical protein